MARRHGYTRGRLFHPAMSDIGERLSILYLFSDRKRAVGEKKFSLIVHFGRLELQRDMIYLVFPNQITSVYSRSSREQSIYKADCSCRAVSRADTPHLQCFKDKNSTLQYSESVQRYTAPAEEGAARCRVPCALYRRQNDQ